MGSRSSPKSSFEIAALRTITIEMNALDALKSRINRAFDSACKLILQTEGKIILTGIGKSGHVANKISATLASTGTPAFFVHPAEALHGDMGMITKSDCVVALSNSGSTAEVLSMLPILKRLGCPLISITGKDKSPLAINSDVHLDASVDIEACPLSLAPTASTTTAMVLGDALAIALLEARGFTEADFAMSHPGGTLGKKLFLKVSDVMAENEAIPRVNIGTSLADSMLEITAKGLGMTTVVDSRNVLKGVFTDGDLRRAVSNYPNFHSVKIDSVMSPNALTVTASMLAAEAIRIMEENKISALVVIDDKKIVRGVVHLMELLRSGLN